LFSGNFTPLLSARALATTISGFCAPFPYHFC
jgi:hypothetical protein